MNLVELELDETLADFEVQDWIDNVFSVQYPDVKARIKKGCNGQCHEKTEWHYPSKGDLPQCDENTQLLFYVKDWNEIRNDYYYHFALGFYRSPFLINGGKMFVEESKGYSCEHIPERVIMWKELVPPEVENA